jgi:putative NADH-flavin reductase
MRVAIFGASGMVGQDALRECLLDPETSQVISILKAASGAPHERLREVVHKDFLEYSPIEEELAGIDACLFIPEFSRRRALAVATVWSWVMRE